MQRNRTVRGGIASAAVMTMCVGASAQFVVPVTHPTIQEAIDDAKAGYEILVLPGTYASFQIYNAPPDLTIRSAEGPDQTIIALGESFIEIAGTGRVLEGFAIDGGSVSFFESEHTLANCRIRAGGDVAFNDGCDAAITNTTFEGPGGGLVIFGTDGIVENCLFENTFGLYIVDTHGPVVVRDTVFRGNQGPTQLGGAGHVSFSESRPVTFERCRFENNHALRGGALYLDYATVHMLDCVFVGNTSTQMGGAVAVVSDRWEPNSTVTRCVFENNIAGTSGGGLLLVEEGDLAMAVTESRFCDNVPENIAGPFSDGGGNTGCCPGDITKDGVVGFTDIVAVLAAWGPCDPGPCPEDLDGNGVVGFSDILRLLEAWGPCPPLE